MSKRNVFRFTGRLWCSKGDMKGRGQKTPLQWPLLSSEDMQYPLFFGLNPQKIVFLPGDRHLTEPYRLLLIHSTSTTN